MAKTQPFDKHTSQYEAWFEENKYAYLSELQAIRALMPESENCIEIGVGSGRFAQPLGIKTGVEPSQKMRDIAEKRGIHTLEGIAEDLPLEDAKYDLVLMVTTICFVDNLNKAFQEASRILKPGGQILIGFIDKESPVGKLYRKYQQESVFYRDAIFYSVDEVVEELINTGFSHFEFSQTIFHPLDKIKKIEPIKEGYGEGSFVVIKGYK